MLRLFVGNWRVDTTDGSFLVVTMHAIRTDWPYHPIPFHIEITGTLQYHSLATFCVTLLLYGAYHLH